MRTTVSLGPKLVAVIDRIMRERGDLKRSHTVMILIREALEARGEYVEGFTCEPRAKPEDEGGTGGGQLTGADAWQLIA